MDKKPDPLRDDFEMFWATYPYKVGRFDAKQEYVFARRVASADEILGGVERYIRIKPDFEGWMKPKNWLKRQHWTDEGATVPAQKPKARSAWGDWATRKES